MGCQVDCGNDRGRGDLVDDEAFGNFIDSSEFSVFDGKVNEKVNNNETPIENNGFKFSDLSGHGNDMTLKTFPTNTKPIDAIFNVTDDAPSFGYAQGAANFKGTTKAGDGALLSTIGSIPEDGKLEEFTLEAVVKVNPEWIPAVNAWSGILTHVPSETQVCQYHKLSCGSNDASGGLFTSSLKELQFFGVAGNGNASSNWSWEINKDYWYHVAIVNDGEYNTMYVDGSRVMRTHKTEQPGWYTMPNGEWAVGVASWEGAYANLFNGKVAEVRLTERALDRNEWLYSHVK